MICQHYKIKQRSVAESDGSRCIVLYKDINPTLLSVHSNIYTKREFVNEYHRLELPRFRLSGHTLAIDRDWDME